MRGYGGNHHEKLGLTRISGASPFNIPDMAVKSPDPACNYTNTRSFQPNEASRTQDFSYPLVSSTSFSSASLICLFLLHNSTIIAEYRVNSSRSISRCQYHELSPSTAYTEYSIHRVKHTPSTTSTQDCLSSLHSNDYALTPEYSISFQCASPCELKGKIT